ncbi:hypothetical protein PLESTM_000342700 [Pleodorina starrii]|nr:hypothetical protein PLESTM_000342700 [Pleodorina starrii]
MGDTALDNILGVRNQVSDNTILTGLWISSVIGVAVTILFCILQRTSQLYRYRLIAGHVRVKPPALQERGLMSFFDWAIKAVSVSDVAFVQSCGLDALMMVKLCSLGVQLFLPLCLLGVLVLIPLHWSGGASKHLDADQSGFMRLTMANIPKGSPVFWVHVAFVYIYLAWAMVLLRWHYHQYLTIRQYYLRKGDNENLWRALYEQKEQPATAAEGEGGGANSRISNLLRSVPLIKAFIPSGVPVASTGHATPTQMSDDDDELASVRKRSARDSVCMSPLGGRAPLHATEGLQRRGTIRHSEIVVRPAAVAAARSASLARRSLPPALFPRGADDAADGVGGHAGPDGAGAFPRRMGQRQISLQPSRASRVSSKRLLPVQRLLPSLSVNKARGTSEADWPRVALQAGGVIPEHDGSGGGSPGPIAEATEGPQERGADEPAAARSRERQPAAGQRPSTPEVSLQLQVSDDGTGGDPASVLPRDSDLEAALGRPAAAAAAYPHTQPPTAVTMVRAVSPAGSFSPYAKPDALPPGRVGSTEPLDADAHYLEWWQERREVELPPGPIDTLRHHLAQTLGGNGGDAGAGAGSGDGDGAAGNAGPGGGGGEGGDGGGGGLDGLGAATMRRRRDVGVDLSRPSVGHRKTVNAESDDGRRVAVLAQHYAVLVTDVVERRQGEGSRGGSKGPGQPQTTPEEPDAAAAEQPTDPSRAPPRRMASFLPRWLRSWCNLQYGSLAARKLDPALRAASSGEISPRDPVSGISTNRTIHTNSLASGFGAQPLVHASAASSANLRIPALVQAPSQARMRSTIEPGPSPLAHRSWSVAGRESEPGGGGGSLPPVAAAAVRQPASLSQKAAPLRNGSGRVVSGGEKLIKVLELMARDARQKLAAQTMNTGAASAGIAAAAAAAVADAAAAGVSETPASSRPPSLRALTFPRAAAVAASAQSPAASAQSSEGPQSPPRRRQGVALAEAGDAAAAGPSDSAYERLSGWSPRVAGAGPIAEASEAGLGCEGEGGAAAAAAGVGEGGGGSGEEHPATAATAARAAAPQPGQQSPTDPEKVGEVGGGSSLRRRRRSSVVAAAPPEGGAEPHASGPGEAAAAAAAATDGAGDDDEDDDECADEDDAVVTAADRWAFLRQAVWDGEVAQLPKRSRYSVVSATFLRLFPDEFDRAIPVINFKEVDLLLMKVDRHMAQYEYAIKYEEETGKQLFGRIGWCGLSGERRRLREYHREQINTLLAQVREARLRAFDTAHTPSWFVFFRTQRAAAMASQCLIHAEDNRQFRVQPAPGPDEVNWSTLWSNFRSRDLRRNLMRPLVVLVVLFPIGIFTGALTQLDYLLCPSHVCVNLEHDSEQWTKAGCTEAIYKRESQQLTWDWYCDQRDPVSKLLKRLVVAWLPSLLLVLWQGMVLPLLFTFVVQVGREARSLSEADRCIAKNMFYFAIFNVFLGGVAGSTIFQGINSAIEKGPSEIFNLIGTYVPTSSNFFINYTMFRAFVAVPLRMLWPHIGVRMYLIRRYLRFSCIITSRERAFLMAPVSPRYGFEVGMVMMIFLVGFAFSVVSPLLLPMALLFFAISWVFWRWALLYVYVRKYEGGGTMWPFTFNRVMVCMAIFPVFTACVFITKHAYVQVG